MTLIDAATGEVVARLEACERIIEKGLASFVEVGEALLTIRDGKLYRAHGTFEAYCADRWGLKRTRAYALISAAVVAKEMSDMSDTPVANERQARALAEVSDDPAERARIWEQVADGGEPTAAAIKDAAKRTAADEGSTEGDAPQAVPAPSVDSHLPPVPDQRLAYVEKFGKSMRAFYDGVLAFDMGEVADNFTSADDRLRLSQFVTAMRDCANGLDAGLTRNQRLRSVR